jgi:hypothetical protein
LLSFSKDADWQVWITHGKKPLPRKILITYKKLPSQPEWEAVLSDWRLDRQVPASFFDPKLPKGAVKIGFIGSEE